MSDAPQGVSQEAWDTLMNAPVTFDPLRDPNWQPSRDDYKALADVVVALSARAEQLEADRSFLPTTSIEFLIETLKERGFDDFAASIEAFLNSTGAAYSVVAYCEEKQRADEAEARVERLTAALRRIEGRDYAPGDSAEDVAADALAAVVAASPAEEAQQ